MSRQLALFILIIFAGCADRRIFENKTDDYKLILKKDSVYFLKYPTIFRGHKVKGTYRIENGYILLRKITRPPNDSIIDCISGYQTFYPDTIEFSFKDLNDSSICVNFRINNNLTVFKTDNSGHLKLLYHDLVSNNILSNDSSFHSINIFYNNKNYFIKKPAIYLQKPTIIEIKLNQFIGEKEAIWYSKYPYSNDSIMFVTRDWKGMYKDIKLTRK